MESNDRNEARRDVQAPTSYSPGALLSIISKSFIVQEERKILILKGILVKSGRDSYNGFYYNKLKDEASDQALTLITPAVYHTQLKDNTTLTLHGYVSRKIDKLGRLEFQVNLVELVHISRNQFGQDDYRKLELIQQKMQHGVKDLDVLIKRKIYHDEPIRIVVLIGKTAIIENDIRTALGAAVAHYELRYERISLTNPQEIALALQHEERRDADIVCVARGGGEQLEVFNQTELVGQIIDHAKVIVSAIGHADDVTLFEQVADKKFATPTAWGNYLKNIYNDTIEELSYSKARLQKEMAEQLRLVYDVEIKNLKTQFDQNMQLQRDEKQILKDENQRLHEQLSSLRKINLPNYVVFGAIVAMLLALLWLLMRMSS